MSLRSVKAFPDSDEVNFVPMDLESLGKVLRERREAIGLSKAAIARKVGVDPSYVATIEQALMRSGRRTTPSRAVLDKWATALGWGDEYALELASLAGHVEPAVVPRDTRSARRLLSVTSFGYPVQPRRLDREVLLRRICKLLDAAEGSDKDWEQVKMLLMTLIQGAELTLQRRDKA